MTTKTAGRTAKHDVVQPAGHLFPQMARLLPVSRFFPQEIIASMMGRMDVFRRAPIG